MSTVTNGPRVQVPVTPEVGTQPESYGKGDGWVLFSGLMLALSAMLNFVWGIAAISGSGFFYDGAHYILLTSL